MVNTDDNTTKLYYALDKQMVAHHDKDDAQSRRQEEKIAHDLIKHADLPLIIRCRALCVLGCSDDDDYVHYAEQSVHFAKLGLAATQEDSGDDTEGKTILRGCEKGLAAAKAAKAVADAKAATKASTESAEMEVEQTDGQEDGKGDEVAEEEDDEEDEEEAVVIRDAKCEDEEDVDDDEEEEVVWHADWDEERKAEAWAAQDRLAAAAADASASTLQTRSEEAEGAV
jgi:hypothetical protein